MVTGGGRPMSPLAAMKLQADQLMAAGRAAEARALFARACSVDPKDADSRVKLSLAERALGRFPAAEAEARRAIKLRPQSFLGHYALGLALHAQGDPKGALRSYATAVGLQPRFPDLHYLRGVALQETGRVAEAEDAFRAALAGRADYVDAMVGLAGVLMLKGDASGAEELLRAAIARNPGASEALANLAALRAKVGAIDDALDLYRRAGEAAPGRADIQIQAADLLERQGQWAEAKGRLDALPDAAGDPAGALVLARIARRENRLEDGIKALEPARTAADLFLAGEAEVMTGQFLDSLKQPGLAFEHLVRGNRLTAEAMGVDLQAQPPYLADVAQARSLLTERLARRGPSTAPPRSPAPAFLIGFPRSGTTLLEQVLDSHPQVQTLDERPTVAALRQAYLGMGGGDLDALSDVQIAELRDAYEAAVESQLDRRPGALVIDKLPLNIIWAHLIWTVFPEARFILALRHPLDACLGCFMQHFSVNTAMSSFLSLENTAATYAAVMGLWRDIDAALPLQVHTVRYEDVVADLQGQAAGVLEFLGLPWDPAVLDPGGTARAKAIISTPSYHQVARPIYSDAAYRWKRYEDQLAGVAPVVQPFVVAFGYA